MSKVITIKDEVYKRLLKLKKKQHMSFSEVLTFLQNFYESKRESTGLLMYAGALKDKIVSKPRLRKVFRGNQ